MATPKETTFVDIKTMSLVSSFNLILTLTINVIYVFDFIIFCFEYSTVRYFVSNVT